MLLLMLQKKFILRSDHVARFLDSKLVNNNDNYAIPIEDLYIYYKRWYKQFVSSRSINYSLENFRVDLMIYSIRIANAQNKNILQFIESIIGYGIRH